MQETEHKRRIRYKGRYPKSFDEKYKEHDPEKYADTVQKVISKGSTPAGMHIPIMVDEILDVFQISENMQGFDATLGYGGHSLEFLRKLNHTGKLYASDIDPIEIEKTKMRLKSLGFTEEDFSARLMNFSQIDALAAEVGKFDFILADLGVSSMQIDNPQRGFTYKADGPLDLRMNPREGISAAELLKTLKAEELEEILLRNSDEPYARSLSCAITKKLKRGVKIDTTGDLYRVIEEVFDKEKVSVNEKKEMAKKTGARVFQALRIEVNHEFEVLEDFLNKVPEVLKPGGKIVILSFHSGEDRLVKQAFKEFLRQGLLSSVCDKVIRPSREECFRNSRAHSTKMRWAVR